MKLAILGTGMIVQDLMKTIDRLPLQKMVLLARERSREKAEKLAKEYHFSGIFYDYDQLLESDIDTVYVALPNHLHYAFARKALEAGKHVIIEKPITADYDELMSLKKIAEERHLMIFEAMSVVHMPAYQKVREAISSLGRIRIISLNYSQYSSRYDRFRNGIILPVFDPHQAGGALMDLNIYNISFITGLFGKPSGVHYHANIDRGIDTSGIVMLDYPDFEAAAIAAKDCRAPMICTIQGDEACLQAHGSVNGMTSFDVIRNDESVSSYHDNSGSHRLLYEFLDFIQAIDTGDYAYMEHLLAESCIVSGVMNDARNDAGIIFDNDLNLHC